MTGFVGSQQIDVEGEVTVSTVVAWAVGELGKKQQGDFKEEEEEEEQLDFTFDPEEFI